MKKTILVTGAAVRIGREIALTFAKDGWNIIIHCNSSTEKAEALAKADGKSAGKSNKKDAKNIKNIAYYLIPVDFEIDGNFIGYIKFKRALSLSNKMLNFDKESIQVVQGDSTGAIKVRGTLTIVGLPDEFF